MKETLVRPLAAFLTTACLAMPLVGCGAPKASGNAEQSEQATVSEPAQTSGGSESAEKAESQTAPAASSAYVVTIDGARVTTDYDGDPAVVITYGFTNNSNENTCFASACSANVFQNGVQCPLAFGTDYDSGTSMQQVQPGGTNHPELMYEIEGTSPIEVEVEDFMSFDDTILAKKTFTLE